MSQQSDLSSAVVGMCRTLCDMAHVLSRMTMIPTPNDEAHKDAIKGGLGELYGSMIKTQAQLLALGDIAGFDVTEIQPESGVPDDVAEKIKEITGFIRGEGDLKPETKDQIIEAAEEEIDKTDMDEEEKEEAKDQVSDLLQKLANRKKKGDDASDDQ